MRILAIIPLLFLLAACWPQSISFKDKGGNNPDWETFSVKTLENRAPNTPLSYSATLSESIKDGIQNNTKLLISANTDSTDIDIEGTINLYSITPVAIQNGDAAAKNRLSISVSFTIFVKSPEEEEKTLTSTRFVDYDSNTDLGIVETTLLEEVNEQIVQDVINKLVSNW